jgi:hypothetical protein
MTSTDREAGLRLHGRGRRGRRGCGLRPGGWQAVQKPLGRGQPGDGRQAVNGWRFWTVEGEQPQPAADVGEQPKKKSVPAKAAGRSKKAATAAPGTPPPGYDYLIDDDGRPIKEDETPASAKKESQLAAAE